MARDPRLRLTSSILRGAVAPDLFYPSLLSTPEHVRRRAEQRPLLLDGSQKLQQQRPFLRIIPVLREIPHHPNRALDRNNLLERKSRFFNFTLQLVRMMKKRRRKVMRIVGRVPVLPILQILPQDLNKQRVADEIA